ncbi:MAG: hypothetical protein N2509_07030 [Treponemataceae bacterium]|nr:hypothetical protein [Treponemataceae bacterium]
MPAVPTPASTTNSERPRCIDLRSRIVLTPEGAAFFQKRVGAGLHVFETPDGDKRYGFKLKALDIPWLKRLLLAGFVDKAEFPVRDLTSVKNEIGDLARLVVFSLQYGFFNAAVIQRAVNSSVIHKWNRSHPHQALDAQNAVSPVELKNALKSRTEAVAQIKKEIQEPVLKNLSLDSRRTPDEKRRLALFVQDLLETVDPLIYFVLLCSTPEERQVIERDVKRLLDVCLERVDLADYLSLMVLELMGAAERSTLISLLGPDVKPSEIRATLERPEKRQELLARLPNGLASIMVWSLSKRWAVDRWRFRLRLSLYDGSNSFEDTKRMFEERGRLSLGERSLQEVYEHGTGPYGDDGLGWYYLSFIGEACEHMGVQFEASVKQQQGKGTSSVNLVLVF